MKHTFREIFWSVVGILVSGAAGGIAGWAVVRGFDLAGVLAAVIAVVTGMAVATGVWLALTLVLRRIGIVP
jgi:hypothetical protein